jgi:mono/diheme cytochrome c family protein
MKPILSLCVACLMIGGAWVVAAQGASPALRSRAKSHVAARSSDARLDTGLAIVPFAVPVAVPVATVRQPSVLYSFRSYVAAYDTASNQHLSTQHSVLSTQPAAGGSTSVGAAVPDAINILTRRCAACHSGASAQGSLRLFGDAGGLLARLPRRRILEAVEAGRMPKPAEAPRLTPTEIEVLRQWAQPPRELEY